MIKNLPILFFLISSSILVFSYLFVDYNLIYMRFFYTGFTLHNRLLTAVVFFILILILFGIYKFILFSISQDRISFLIIRNLIILLIAVLFFSYPAMLSYDIFNYMTTSKITFQYRENPYVVMPIEMTQEPFLIFTRAANKIALYGPVWISFTALPFVLSGGNFFVLLFSTKLLTVLFYCLSLFLIWKIKKNLFSLAFFAFNPLVILEVLVSSHNDIVMMFFALFGYYFLSKRKIALAFLLLICSILIKYSTILLVPIFLISTFNIYYDKKVDWEKVYMYSFLSMLLMVFISSFREEIYPWYGVWFLIFASLISDKKYIVGFSFISSCALLFRYIPVLATGTYFGMIPLYKTLVTFLPISLFLIYILVKDKLWRKFFFLSY